MAGTTFCSMLPGGSCIIPAARVVSMSASHGVSKVAYAASVVSSGLPPFDVGNELAQRALDPASSAAEVPRQVGRPDSSVPPRVDAQLPLAAARTTPFGERASQLLPATECMSKSMTETWYVYMN